MDIAIVGDKYLASGFRLIGIDAVEAIDDDDAAKKVENTVSEGKYRIIAISERVALKTKPLRDNLLAAKKAFPVFLIIPDFEGPRNERIKELRQLVDEAMGIKLKIE